MNLFLRSSERTRSLVVCSKTIEYYKVCGCVNTQIEMKCDCIVNLSVSKNSLLFYQGYILFFSFFSKLMLGFRIKMALSDFAQYLVLADEICTHCAGCPQKKTISYFGGL